LGWSDNLREGKKVHQRRIRLDVGKWFFARWWWAWNRSSGQWIEPQVSGVQGAFGQHSQT